MQLWKKFYLLTFTVFLLVLDVCLLLLVTVAFRNDFKNGIATAVNEEKNVLYSISSFYESENQKTILAYLSTGYGRNNIYLSIRENGDEVMNTLPKNISLDSENEFYIITSDKTKYFYMADVAITEEDVVLNITFLKDIGYIYKNQNQRLLMVIILSLLLGLFVGGILYVAFKKIYKPVNNIAHELRTPLTNIYGYAQYLMSGGLTEEDRLFANEYILNETRNMKEIVEKLLMLGSLNRGGMKKEKINFKKLLAEIQSRYPQIRIKNNIVSILGDEILLKSLIHNLVENALKTADTVSVTAKDNKIMVADNGEPIEGNKLKSLNKNYGLSKGDTYGHGYGVSLCHEIVRLHKGKLLFASSAETGTVVTITLPAKIVTAGKEGGRAAAI